MRGFGANAATKRNTMNAKLRVMRDINRAGLAAAERDGDGQRAALYEQCLKNVSKKAKEQRDGAACD